MKPISIVGSLLVLECLHFVHFKEFTVIQLAWSPMLRFIPCWFLMLVHQPSEPFRDSPWILNYI